MNERVMQFRLGMFVIVAGLVLTMLIVWFGESPSLFRDHVFVTVHYLEAPGVAEGTPVRKSGIHVGEVTAIAFDDRPNQPDGVLVTLSLERRFRIKAGSVPQISRSLIGDVAIDLLPGTGPGLLATSASPEKAPIIEGTVAPDPSKALAAATKAFEKAGDTLEAINLAAGGIAKFTKNVEDVDDLMATWNATGKKVSAAADGIDRFIRANEADFQPAVTNLRQVTQKLNETLDGPTQARAEVGPRSVLDRRGPARLQPGQRRAPVRGPRRVAPRDPQDRLRPDGPAPEPDHLRRQPADPDPLRRPRQPERRGEPPEDAAPRRAVRQHEPDGDQRQRGPDRLPADPGRAPRLRREGRARSVVDRAGRSQR